MEKRNVLNTLSISHMIPLKEGMSRVYFLIKTRCMQACRDSRQTTNSSASQLVTWCQICGPIACLKLRTPFFLGQILNHRTSLFVGTDGVLHKNSDKWNINMPTWACAIWRQKERRVRETTAKKRNRWQRTWLLCCMLVLYGPKPTATALRTWKDLDD